MHESTTLQVSSVDDLRFPQTNESVHPQILRQNKSFDRELLQVTLGFGFDFVRFSLRVVYELTHVV